MLMHKFIEQFQDNIEVIIKEQPPLGSVLWQEFLELHPADAAQVLSYLDHDEVKNIFAKLDRASQASVFTYLPDNVKKIALAALDESDRAFILSTISLASLTDFLDELSDDELKNYLTLLHKREREQVIALLKFPAESAGGVMDTNVLSLRDDLTVEKSIQILQRLQPSRELHHTIFITDEHNRLVGEIKLEDLVLKSSQTVLKAIMKSPVMVVLVDEDQEEVAKRMIHYGVTIAPVIEEGGTFLGVITSSALVKIVEEEAGEDIYRMSTMTPIKGTYFGTSFYKLFYQRSSILIILLLVQTLSSIIIQHYQVLLAGFLSYFLSMLISAGGNASSQTSALVIQGMATGEINPTTNWRFIKRELLMAAAIAVVLGIISFIRVYLTYGYWWESIAVSISLSLIIVVSMTLGTCMPFILKRLNIDPAYSAGPLLTTMIDVIGLLIYCKISYTLLT